MITLEPKHIAYIGKLAYTYEVCMCKNCNEKPTYALVDGDNSLYTFCVKHIIKINSDKTKWLSPYNDKVILQ